MKKSELLFKLIWYPVVWGVVFLIAGLAFGWDVAQRLLPGLVAGGILVEAGYIMGRLFRR